MTIATNLAHIHHLIHTYELKYHRTPGSVSLLAASKTQPLEKIQDAIAAGQHVFGENYVQEALPKIALLANQHIEWHFIGAIQTNKTKKIAEKFAWAHGVSDSTIAKRLSKQRPTHLPPLNVCIEVNVSHEQSKAGIDFDELLSLASACVALPHITLRGLMTIPAIKENFDEQRAEFKKLRLAMAFLREKGFNLDTLSMGMSHDMEAAIAEGSTMVRIGTNIFGKRE